MTDLDKAFDHHKNGRLEEAESAYRAALQEQPDNSEILHFLGVLLCQRQKPEEGVPLLKQAAEKSPDDARAHYNLAKALQTTGKHEGAVTAYHAALQIKPDYPDALNNLGNLHHAANRVEKARLCFERAVNADPSHADAAFNLSVAYRDLGLLEHSEKILQKLNQDNPRRREILYALGNILRDQEKLQEARAIFEQLLEVDPDNACSRHLVSVLKGENPEAPPREYILELFNPYANRFEHQLVERLHYHAPQKLAELVAELRKNNGKFANALDLGCGTGLSGQAFHPLSERISGVDLAPNMVDQASRKNLYANLAVDDVVPFLNTVPETFDLFIATDVFIYLGNLEPLFKGVVGKARANAWFAFSTESVQGPDFEAMPTGRYAHSMFYIQRLADTFGFKVAACRETDIREERGYGVPGHLFVLMRGNAG